MDGNIVAQLFPGIASFMVQDTTIAIARIALIAFGFILAYLGFKRILEPLIMVPMGIGMICINCGVLFLDGGKLGTLFLDPLVSDPAKLVDIMQINFLQPIYNLTFSNSLVACVVFLGVGAMCEIGFILANPWTSIIIAIFAECGTFVTLVLGVHLGLTPPEAAAVASIGGADGPMVLFTSLMLAPHLFVPISVIAYLYLSLTYAGYPWLVKLMVPKALRGKDIMYYAPEVPKSKKFIFILVCCGLLCLLLPMAAPLIMSFFLGMAIKESEIVPYWYSDARSAAWHSVRSFHPAEPESSSVDCSGRSCSGSFRRSWHPWRLRCLLVQERRLQPGCWYCRCILRTDHC